MPSSRDYHTAFGRRLGTEGRDESTSNDDDRDPDDEEMDADELREEIEALERELADCEAEVESLERRREDLEAAAAERREFSESVHEVMRTVGTDARTSIIALDDPNHYRANGTGWVVEDGTIVTAGSVVAGPAEDAAEGWTGPIPDGPDALVVETIDGDELPVEETTVDDGSALALVAAETGGLDPLPVGSADGLEDGDPLLVLGHPAQMGRWVMTLGRYAGEDGTDRFRIDAPVSPATTGRPFEVAPISGAPIFDRGGDVVGTVVGPRPRTADPAPGTHTKSETLFQRLADTYDLLAVDGTAVADRVGKAHVGLHGMDRKVTRD